ncbi:MAG: hypothetical protein ACI8QP_000532 [Porticoccaceae bacterium]|jgi:hypothetical protein
MGGRFDSIYKVSIHIPSSVILLNFNLINSPTLDFNCCGFIVLYLGQLGK